MGSSEPAGASQAPRRIRLLASPIVTRAEVARQSCTCPTGPRLARAARGAGGRQEGLLALRYL